MSYPGGKGASFRHIINLMPPHELYVETHLGGGSVFLHKRAAANSILIDIDPAVVSDFIRSHPVNQSLQYRCFCVNAHDFLKNHTLPRNALAYLDPPYLMETRSSGSIYRFEYDRSHHEELLSIILGLECFVIISGYPNDLYDDALSSWYHITYNTVTRAGNVVPERAWFNFPPPTYLHDYSWLGNDFRERDILRRQQKRWVRRLKSMPILQRHAILFRVVDEFYEHVSTLTDPFSPACIRNVSPGELHNLKHASDEVRKE